MLLNGWMREGVCPNSRGHLRRFLSDPTKFAPVCFRGHFEEIGIAKVLLNSKPRRVGKFWDVGFPTSEKVWREKKNKKLHKI